MKKLLIFAVIGVLVSLGLASSAFCAHGGGHGGGYHGGGWHGGYWGPRVYFGGFYGWPYYYPYYYPYGYPSYPYYPYPYSYAESQPPVYVQPQENSYWYYCQNPQGYYPYVESCPGGWTRVAPIPPEPGKEGVAR